MTWIHQRSSWPAFTWDSKKLEQKLAEVRYRQGHLLGRMESLNIELRVEANLDTLTEDVVQSSAIEGAQLNPSEVRSSIARRLGVDTRDSIAAGRDIAHLWFITIHPFEDGNGRIARAIADMALAQADGMSDKFYSMSAQIEAERKTYYTQLERQQRSSIDITGWLDWFLDCLGRALIAAETSLSTILYKAELWKRANRQSVNTRQRLILSRMLNGFKGHINTSKYAKLAKCSTDSALRDIQNLVSKGLLMQNPGGGRSTSYRLPNSQEIAEA